MLLSGSALGLQRRENARPRSARGRDRARGRNESLGLGVGDGAHDLVALKRRLGVLRLEQARGWPRLGRESEVRKRDGAYKARLVVRSDPQVWGDWESATIDGDEPGTFSIDEMGKIKEPASLDPGKTDGLGAEKAEVKSDTQLYDMFGDGAFGMMTPPVPPANKGRWHTKNANLKIDQNITSKPSAMPECPWVSHIRQGRLCIHRPHHRTDEIGTFRLVYGQTGPQNP